MNTERNALKAGFFIVVSMALIVGVIISIKGWSGELMQVRKVTFKLADDIGGLQVGDDVRIGGFRVGTIRSITPVDLDGGEKSNPRLIITILMPRRYVLRPNPKVAVQSTLTGSTSMNIEDLGRGDPLPDDAEVAGRPDPKSALLATLGDLAPEVKGAVSDVRTKTIPKVNDAVTHIDGLVADSRGDVRDTMSNLKSLTGTVREKIPETMTRANGLLKRIDESVEHAQVTLEDLKETAANTREISASAKGIIGGNKGKLEAMIASLKVTGDNLKFASAEIRHSPWRLLYKPGSGEMSNLNLYDSARQFAEGANSLSDAAASLRDALQSKESDKQRIDVLVQKLDKSFDNFQEVEDKLWTQVK